ncbi:SEC-C domain-containing protein [Clostridium sp. HBUAS56017]|uniref:SEC-C metal-binding domain-containing protein n=1 Tax=Clostridium sp. HBUAS56017 TaxID=2571128 RepID=UPI001178B892|nr:SEC-C domain-containing protein [Clostridium sp. HBUAS56017]
MKMEIMGHNSIKKIAFSNEEKCPCGSNKKYKECCEPLYDFIGYNYKDVPVLLDKDKTKKSIEEIEKFSKSHITNSYNLQNGITIRQGLDILEKLYKLFDEKFELQSQYASCEKGCSGTCCNIIAECTPIEAELIRRYVRKNFNNEIIKKIELYNAKNIKEVPRFKESIINDNLRYEYYEKEIKCMFLDKNNECLIYNIRPFTCRKHIVFSSPKKCMPGKTENRYIGSINDIMEKCVYNISLGVYGELFKIRWIRNYFYNTKAIQLWFENGFGKINFEID